MLTSSDECVEFLLISGTGKAPPGAGCVCEFGNNNGSIYFPILVQLNMLKVLNRQSVRSMICKGFVAINIANVICN